jgi:hypothetical protein
MQALAASCEELRARTGNPPLDPVQLLYAGRVVMGFIPTHPLNIPSGVKREYLEKTHDFR